MTNSQKNDPVCLGVVLIGSINVVDDRIEKVAEQRLPRFTPFTLATHARHRGNFIDALQDGPSNPLRDRRVAIPSIEDTFEVPLRRCRPTWLSRQVRTFS